MKRNIIIAALLVIAAALLPAKVTTIKDADSPTGYTSTFVYKDDEATDVRLVGSFLFYENNDYHVFSSGMLLGSNDSIANYYTQPEDWTKDKDLRHAQDEGYSKAMTKTVTGWTASLQLPCASYMYYYSVSYDGGKTWDIVSDPDNLPPQNAWSMYPQYRSQFFVPYDAVKQNAADDWTWLMPLEDESLRGTVEYREYTGINGEARPAQIYLPADYDAEREEPYKVLYMIHGTGGFEGDWFHQGNVPNIADRVFALGKNEPFIIVAMENNGLIDSANNPIYELIRSDMNEGLIPMIEESYNVVEDASGRAITGLSRGGRISGTFLLNNPEDYAYIAPLSGGAANLYDGQPVEPMKETKVFLGAGFIDQASYASGEKSTSTFSKLLDQLGVDYNDGSIVLVPGAHDWFTWPQLVKLYFEDYLWK